MRRALFAGFGLAISLFAIAGCESPRPPGVRESAGDLAGAPDWVVRGCAGSHDRICGVGSAAGMQNSALRRTAAIGRARTDIARSIQSRVTSMLEDYAATTEGVPGYGMASKDEQHLVDVSKQITNVTLSGTEVIDTWVSQNASFYALVGLDVAKFSDTVRDMSQLSEDIRQAVVERADAAFSGGASPEKADAGSAATP